MLINNNDRNEDNWGIIKYKKENSYKLSPIYDCGNSFYGKTSDERITDIMSSEEKLMSSSLNGITAYEDDNEKRISNLDIIKYVKKNNPESINRVLDLVNKKFEQIKEFINNIPNNFNDIVIMSEIRKEYYIKTFEIRLNKLEENI